MSFKKLVQLKKKQFKLENQLSQVKEEIDALQAPLIKQMQKDGMHSVKQPSGVNIRIDRKLWASAGGDTERLMKALHKAGLDEFVGESVKSQGLTGYIREHDPDGILSPKEVIERLPAPLRKAVAVKEVTQLIVTGHKK